MTDKSTDHPTESIYSLKFWLLPISCFLISVVVLSLSAHSYGFGHFGTNDFIEYWSAFQLALEGSNPYESAQMLKAQQTIVPDRSQPLMMWNPPWLLGLMYPILKCDFATASKLWFACNILLLVASIKLLWTGLLSEKSLLLPSILAVFFLPIANALSVGQISLLILFACSLLLLALKQKRYFLAGMAIALLTVKPHLVLLLLVAIFWFSLLDGKVFRKLLLGFVVTLGLLAAITCVLSSNLLTQYFHAQFNQSGVTGVSQWLGAIPMAYFRLALEELGYGFSDTPVFLLPLVFSVITFAWLTVSRPNISWDNAGPTLVTLSIVTASFGWLFDLSLLFIPLLWQLRNALRSHLSIEHLRLAFMLCALLVAGILALSLESPQHHHFAWLPLAFLCCSKLTILQRELPLKPINNDY